METIEYLVNNGVDVNCKNKLGISNLDLFISEGYTFLSLLLSYNNNILLNIPNLQGETPLITLIKINTYTDEEKEDIIDCLIKKGSDVNFIDNLGNSPLVYAIQKKSLSIVNLLIKNEANLNYIIKSRNQSILMYAIELEEMEIIHILIEYGADINFKNSEGDSAIKMASQKGKLDIFEYLVKYDINNFNSQVINEIISEERLDLLIILVNNHLDINIKDENENTPLVYAFKNRQPDIVKYLIENGADIYNKNKQGETIEQLNYKYFYEFGWHKSYNTIHNLIKKRNKT
ncbi:ankyrin [Anaeromyces robustus]|uniref:Ankyrin n=1 Tax=Anaeromyces robustus TaxID=1754192 RepID=A0A1Y1XPK1_9FUNG|nr:ankyrin [Anaeromyces robustus]|eukprot:ORX87446.1 ankyrin [Anaeromyces robustus]